MVKTGLGLTCHPWQLAALALPATLALALADGGPSAATAISAELPVRLAKEAKSLDGEWHFRYVPSLDAGADESFSQPAHDVSAWKTIPVPSHWELQGYAEPTYSVGPVEGLGLYRRTFRVPAEWRGKRVFLNFDGVMHGFTAWVNGREVGQWSSGFNPVTFDITDALLVGVDDNVLAVRVTTRSHGWDFDTMDCWSLSGIYRDVTLFALPEERITDFTARTTLQTDGTARLMVFVEATARGKVSCTLTRPDGETDRMLEIPLDDNRRGSATIDVSSPLLWTAESPALYRLELGLIPSGSIGPTHRVTDRVGLREVTIADGILKLNGRPIKLRGINHHDIWPEEGRVATVERMRRDLELIREANVNFIRTSHYPPHPLFIGMCDEMGFYVACEAPFIHGREHLTDPGYQADLLVRARATVARDKNHPSIIFWSIGNENPVNDQGLSAGRLIKSLDPTRPVAFPTMGSHFKENWEKFPEFVELYTPHYPGPERVRELAGVLTRPIVVTEFAHQRGIARAGDGVEDIWEAMWSSPRVAGGAVWHFQDQGILRTAAGRAAVENGDLMVWLGERRYFDTHGYFGVDGIVFSDRQRQADFWQLREVYCPVRIRDRSFRVRPGEQTLELTVQNRHDFRPLDGMKVAWTLQRNGESLAAGEAPLSAPPHEKQTVPITVSIPSSPGIDVFTLTCRCLDENAVSLGERSIRLDTGVAETGRLLALERSLPEVTPLLESTDERFTITSPDWRLAVDRHNGSLTITASDGTPLVTACGPHTGRKPTITELGKKREGALVAWSGELMEDVTELETSAEHTDEGLRLTVRGRYPRPGAPEQAVSGMYRLDVKHSGAIAVTYDYRSVDAQGLMNETGLAFALPAHLSEFRWIGHGPFAAYPGRERSSQYGIHHLGRDDLYFPGNRRGVEVASIADTAGRGVLLAGPDEIVSVEHRGPTTLVSHVASGVVNFDKKSKDADKHDGTGIPVKAARPSATISGSFTLIPLSGSWPAVLTAWFGPCDRVATPFRPYAHVYDQ